MYNFFPEARLAKADYTAVSSVMTYIQRLAHALLNVRYTLEISKEFREDPSREGT